MENIKEKRSAAVLKESIRTSGGVMYTLCRKNVKNINLRVKKEGVFVSAPAYVSVSTVDAFVASKKEFIVDALSRMKSGAVTADKPREYKNGDKCGFLGRRLTLEVVQGTGAARTEGDRLCVYVQNPGSFLERKTAVWRFYSEQANLIFGKYIDKYSVLFREYGVRVRKVTIKNMTSRWGSCTPAKGNISLNIRLLITPEDCIEYVIAHEFCHFLEQNHSQNFYAFVAKYIPDWREKREALKRFSDERI